MSETRTNRWYRRPGTVAWIGVGAIAAAYFTGRSELVLAISLVAVVAIYASQGSFSRGNIDKRKGQFLKWYGSAVSRQKVVAAMFAGLILSWFLGFIVFESESAASNLMVLVTFGLILVLAVTVATTKVKPASSVSGTKQQVSKISRVSRKK